MPASFASVSWADSFSVALPVSNEIPGRLMTAPRALSRVSMIDDIERLEATFQLGLLLLELGLVGEELRLGRLELLDVHLAGLARGTVMASISAFFFAAASASILRPQSRIASAERRTARRA